MFLWAADRGVAPDASSWITECASISPNATGNLSDANGTGCVLPANETSVVPSGSRIAGEGSLVLPEGAVLTCGVGATEYCALTVALGTDARLVLGASARLSAGSLNVTAGAVELGDAARVDADGRGDPGERRGWSGDGGAGYGGDGAACPGGDGTALPPHTGGAGYAFQEFINVGFFHKTSAPPPQGTGAGGAGGGAVAVVARTLLFGAAPPSPRTVPRPRSAPRIWAAGRGIRRVLAGEVVVTAGDAAAGGTCAGGGAGAAEGGGGGGGGGGRVAPLAPAVWPPSVRVGAGGGAVAAGRGRVPRRRRHDVNAATGHLVVSNRPSPGASRRHRRCAWRTAPGARAR